MEPHAAPEGPLLDVQDLHTHFAGRRRTQTVRAVDGVSLHVSSAETLGLVGESGCGKTTLARTILRLVPATAGRALFEGRDVFRLQGSELRKLRRRLQVIFQDPYSSLNPRLPVDQLVGEALHIHGVVRTAAERRARVAALLRRVGLAEDAIDRYPRAFSGGQRQRIGIARALALEPRLILCDEPVSALDVSIQSQILNLLAEIQAQTGVSYLMISHSLPVVRATCHRIAVMYAGRIVETGSTEALFRHPSHPYTLALLAAAPRIDAARAGRSPPPTLRHAEMPQPAPSAPHAESSGGCNYLTHCPFARSRCYTNAPLLAAHDPAAPGHQAACHYADQVARAARANAEASQTS